MAHLGAFGGPLYLDEPGSGNPVRRDVAAVLFSGDMGFHTGMGPHVAERLTATGIPVTRVSSLHYFRTRRTPADVTRFVTDAMTHAERVSGARRLILIGQSYGSDMLQVGLAGMSPSRRGAIAMVGLIVPTDTVYFRISPGEMFEWTTPDAEALPTAKALDWAPVLCVSGAEETTSLCPHLTQANVHHVVLPGGHPLHHDIDALAPVLLRAIGQALPDRSGGAQPVPARR